MRVLIIGPRHQRGSIPPYLHVLSAALRHLGAHVDWTGSAGVPYDRKARAFRPAQRIIQEARKLLRGVDLNSYDILSVHFGNLDVEQLTPHLWGTQHPPAVYHVHSLDWPLFSAHIPDPGLRSKVSDGVASMNGFVFFGSYSAGRLAQGVGTGVPSIVSWLPTTITLGTRPWRSGTLVTALRDGRQPLGSLYGYAAPWKDAASFIAACQRTTIPNRAIIGGPLWDDPSQAGTDLAAEIAGTVHGAARVRVIPRYLDRASRLTLVAASEFAVFPYCPHPCFQGSGAIADYLAHGVPVLATDVANMAELVGDAGVIIHPGDPESMASALDRLASDSRHRATLAGAARHRASQFTAVHHAADCLRLYEAVAARESHRIGRLKHAAR